MGGDKIWVREDLGGLHAHSVGTHWFFSRVWLHSGVQRWGSLPGLCRLHVLSKYLESRCLGAMTDETSVPWWAITNKSLLQNGLSLVSPGALSLMWCSAISQTLLHALKEGITFYRARKPELHKQKRFSMPLELVDMFTLHEYACFHDTL